ncbi:hypothetical protein FRC98_03845 [Lujinxingia vulgaris]|uniref:Uncharacterized protein n=2 Tax=Lujinxingia vulgaris TaxID=2600176 RepID=A0A5C6XIQ1_9DELT|nr:hypothetical protein FRC98_03845 [Lujinxingia vulgaris]
MASFVALMLWSGAAIGQTLPEAQQGWEQSQRSVEQARQRLERALGEYQKSVERLEKLKADEARGQASRRQLEEALRQSHTLVEGVREHQIALLTQQAELERARQSLIDALAARRAELEQRVARSSGSEQLALIEELNALSRTQAQVRDVAPGVDPQRVERVLADAHLVEGGHPRDLLAVADELEDTEAQLRERLTTVETRLNELERSRALMRRARDFSTRERFFEENDRARAIARQEREVANGDTPRGDQEGVPVSEDAASPDPQPGAPTDDFDSSGEDPNVGSGDFDTPEAEPTPEPGADFEPSTERVLIESLVDPQQIDESAPALSEDQTERNVRALRRERERLEAQVEELRERARQLREEAEDAWR